MVARYGSLGFGFFALVAVAACGGDGDSGSGASVSTGLPKQTKLSSLSGADTIKACTSTAKAFNSVLPKAELEDVTCTIAALSSVIEANQGEVSASNVPECKKISTDCMNGKGDITTDTVSLQIANEEDCKDADKDSPFADCDATIADYESCAGRAAGEFRTRLRAVSCENLSDLDQLDEDLNGEFDLASTAECKALQTKCPDLDLSFGSASSEGN